MNYSHEVETMCVVAKGPHHGLAPIPEEGRRWPSSFRLPGAGTADCGFRFIFRIFAAWEENFFVDYAYA